MKPCHLTISSKNHRSINKFVILFQNSIESNFNMVKKNFQRKTRKKKLTLLKSPHVNKTAQEQFEYRIFSKQISIYLSKHLRCLVLLKKLKTDLFPDVNVKVKFAINHKNTEKLRIKVLNPNNFRGNFYNSSNYKNIKSVNIEKQNNDHIDELRKIRKTIRTMSTYGELLINKNYVWIAQ